MTSVAAPRTGGPEGIVPMATPHTGPPPHAMDPDAWSRLTGRELLLLQLLARGYSLAQCAQLLEVPGTEALAAARNAARKLGVRDATAAVFEVCLRGLLV